MRGARICYPRVPRLMREDHRRISPRCVTNRNSSCTISLDHTRHITLPAARLDGPPGTKLSQHARLDRPPGTKLSQQAPKRRFRPTFRMQGELFTASATNNPSRENFIPHAGPLPVQNSPSKRPWQAHPVQNSPSEPQNADFGPFCASRENFVPFPPPTRQAGRTLSRTQSHFRYKTLPAHTPDGPNRYKTRPAARLAGPPGTELSQHARLGGPPGTKLSQRAPKRRFRPTFRMQGELFTASATNTTSREKKVTHQHSTAPQQRAALQISHAIRLPELSIKPRNVAIPTI